MSNPNLPADSWGMPPEREELPERFCGDCDAYRACPNTECYYGMCIWYDKFTCIDDPACDHWGGRNE